MHAEAFHSGNEASIRNFTFRQSYTSITLEFLGVFKTLVVRGMKKYILSNSLTLPEIVHYSNL